MYKDPRSGGDFMPGDTIITCKHFLDAVEDELYGWRWVCPNNGNSCQYRHMLPVGYIVTSKKDREKAKAAGIQRESDTTTLEELIEEERAALPSAGLTPITKETFFAWKAKRAAMKQSELEERLIAAEALKSSKKGMGKDKNKGIMNGRALFTYNPNMFQDDENAAGEDAYEEEKIGEDGDGAVKESQIDQALFAEEGNAELDEDVNFD